MTASSILSGNFPATGTVAGREVTLHYGNIAAEYNALRSGAMLVDRSARGRMRFFGAKAAEMVTGLVTNDVLALAPGEGLYAAALTPKGKIVADLRILARESELIIDVPPRAFAGWQAMVKKYINPQLTPSEDVTAAVRGIGVFGSTARRIVANLTAAAPDTLAALAVYSHASTDVQGEQVVMMRSPELELEGYELFVPSAVFGH